MLRTFDDSLVITAVQQLTTDLDSMAARIKKLEEGGGSGGFEFICEYIIENQESITSGTATPIAGFSMPEGFSIANDEILIAVTTLENEEPHPKVLKTISTLYNLTGKTSGSIQAASIVVLYLNSSGVLSQGDTTTYRSGIWLSQYQIGNNMSTLAGCKVSTTGYVGGKVTTKIYKTKIPA